MDCAAQFHVRLQHVHLSAANSGAHVAKSVIVADCLVVVVRPLLAGLCGIEFHAVGFLFGVAHQCAATRSGDNLVSVETQASVVAEGSAFLAFVFRTESLGGVFYDRNAVFVGYCADFIHLSRHAIEINWDYCFWIMSSLLLAVYNRFFQRVRRHVPCVGLAVDKHRVGALVFYWVGACGECE